MLKREVLCNLSPGETGVIIDLKSEPDMKRRLLDLGVIKNTLIECVGTSPSGDPSAYLIRGAVIAIRKSDCEKIYINKIL